MNIHAFMHSRIHFCCLNATLPIIPLVYCCLLVSLVPVKFMSTVFWLSAGPKPVPPTSSGSPGPQDSPGAGAGDFHVGERVWVNGNKPGYVHFVGGTQFAPGQWAGIVLDEPIGKNDGSVAEVRYFQCDDQRGIFTRPSKLSRTPVAEPDANGAPSKPKQAAPAASASVSASAAAPAPGTATPASGAKGLRPSESVSNLSETDSTKAKRVLKLGDRVLVS